jgi:hypothetical protein
MFAGEGCSNDDLPRQPVAGFVTLDGQALSSGAISFYPDILEDPNFLPESTGAMIKDGYFSIPRTFGLVPGRYEVAINAAQPREKRSGRDREPGNDPVLKNDRIPAKYNSQTRLVVDIKNAAIKNITFHLESE